MSTALCTQQGSLAPQPGGSQRAHGSTTSATDDCFVQTITSNLSPRAAVADGVSPPATTMALQVTLPRVMSRSRMGAENAAVIVSTRDAEVLVTNFPVATDTDSVQRLAMLLEAVIGEYADLHVAATHPLTSPVQAAMMKTTFTPERLMSLIQSAIRRLPPARISSECVRTVLQYAYETGTLLHETRPTDGRAWALFMARIAYILSSSSHQDALTDAAAAWQLVAMSKS